MPIRAAGSRLLPAKPLYGAKQGRCDLHWATLGNKSGELYVAVDGGRWDDGPGKGL